MRLEWTLWPYAGLVGLALAIWLAAGAIAAAWLRGLMRFVALALVAPAIVPGHGEMILVPAAPLLLLDVLWAKTWGALWMIGFASAVTLLSRSWLRRNRGRPI